MRSASLFFVVLVDAFVVFAGGHIGDFFEGAIEIGGAAEAEQVGDAREQLAREGLLADDLLGGGDLQLGEIAVDGFARCRRKTGA